MNSYILKLMTVVAIATVVLASCSKINESVPGNGFRASTEHTGGNAKTHIAPDWGNDNTTDILWSENDLIKVANQSGQTGCEVHTYQLTQGENTTMGLFYTGEEHENFFEPDYLAIYPAYNSEGVENTISGTTATFHIPAVQRYKENSFGEGCMPMVSYSETQSLSFKNLFGGLCVPLTSEVPLMVKRIKLISFNYYDNLWGTFTVDCSGSATNNYGLTCLNTTSCRSVTLDCGDGVLVPDNDSVFFCFMLPPGSINGTGSNQGFKIEVYDMQDELVGELATIANPNITRNNISLVGTKQYAYADLDQTSGLLLLCLFAILTLLFNALKKMIRFQRS